METIQGKTSLEMDAHELYQRLAGYDRVALDIGTGDGRYVHHLADRNPHQFIIGVDACRENLHEHSRAKSKNMLFVIANVRNLPWELHGLCSQITINFPWGSLLEDLLSDNLKIWQELENLSSPVMSLELRLNGGALQQVGTDLETGTRRIHDNLLRAGWQVHAPGEMDRNALRSFPSTWARRLAFGRDPRASMLSGCFRRK